MAKKEIVVSERKQYSSLQHVNKGEKNKITPYTKEETLKEVTKPGCRLCNSKFRKEAETMFLKQRQPNYNAIVALLHGKGEHFNWTTVRNHLVVHFQGHNQKEYLMGYGEDLERWIDNQPNRIFSLKEKIAILEREMITLGAEGEDLPIVERRKNAETLKKIADTLLKYEDKLDQYEKQMEPVTVVVNQLRIIINDEITTLSTPETKKVLVNVLEKLQDRVGDMIVQRGD